jgi:hypothetical protein
MINIITVFMFGDRSEIDLTIKSIKCQRFSGYSVTFVLSKCTVADLDWLKSRVDFPCIYIVNRDTSLYNAMNIGLDSINRGYVLFLNGGDSLSDSDSLGSANNNLDISRVNYFATIQVFGNDGYIRLPKAEARGWSPAHQGFVAHTDLINNIYFDESFSIAADSIWMTRLVALHGVKAINQVLSIFHLGGISNHPSRHTILQRYRSQGVIRAVKEAAKCLALSFFGSKIYYRIIFFAKYDRININDIRRRVI